ncbi:MAG: hypothetical protein ACYCS7_05965, partial [Acidimicrobiales bacterium]
GDRSGDGAIRGAARHLGRELNQCRRESYQSADAVSVDEPRAQSEDVTNALPGDGAITGLLAHRAWGLDVARRATMALVSAMGGTAIASSQPPQRLAREAMFYTVQAQTAMSRVGTLDLLSRSPRNA